MPSVFEFLHIEKGTTEQQPLRIKQGMNLKACTATRTAQQSFSARVEVYYACITFRITLPVRPRSAPLGWCADYECLTRACHRPAASHVLKKALPTRCSNYYYARLHVVFTLPLLMCPPGILRQVPANHLHTKLL